MVNEDKLREYCCEPIENIPGYWTAKNDDTRCYEAHHIEEDDGFSMNDLKRLGRYFKVPANKLVILTRSEHRKRHPLSEDAKRRIGEANKGKVITEKHKAALRYERTEETRQKLSESKTKYHIDQAELRHLREDLNYTLKQCAEYFKTSLMTVSRACRKIPK